MSDWKWWLYGAALVWNVAEGMYYDLYKKDRLNAAYHIAWMGVFLAALNSVG